MKSKYRAALLEGLEARNYLTATPTVLTTITIPGSTNSWDTSKGAYSPSPIFADLFNDGQKEILAVGGDNKLHAYKYASGAVTEILTFVQTTPAQIESTPVVMDTPLGRAVFVGNHSGEVYGWYASTAQLLPGWPRDIHPTAGAAAAGEEVLTALTAGDVDNDGNKEIIVSGFSHELNVFHYDGTRLFQFNNDDTVSSSPVVADMDGDGNLEIVCGGDSSSSSFYWSGGRINIVSNTGKRELQYQTDQIISSSPALADINNDGFLEIIVGTGYYYGVDSNGHYPGNKVYAIDHNGNAVPGWPFVTESATVDGRVHSSPAIADLNNDGYLDVVVGDGSGNVIAISHNGTELWRRSLPAILSTSAFNIWSSPIIADVNGDGKSDVIVGAFGSMIALDGATGALLWNNQSTNQFYTNSAAIGQFKGDGSWQLAALGNAVGTNYSLGAPAILTIFNVPNSTLVPAWAQFRRDGENNAVVRSDTVNTPLITKLYANTLGRSSVVSEVNGWLPYFSRTQNLESTIMLIAGSQEARQYNIRQWYLQYLNRTAEDAGVAGWLAYLGANHSYASCQANIIGSQEAFVYRGGGTNEGWIRFMYDNLLHRTPSDSEVTNWVQSLNAGTQTRASVSQTFLMSQERSIKAALNWYNIYNPGGQTVPTSDDQEAIGWDLRKDRRTEEQTLAYVLSSNGTYAATTLEGSWIQSLYKDLLGRSANTTETGYLLSLIETGTPQNNIASMLLNTDEYRKHLVNVYYQQYLGRPASTVDQTNWSNALASGTTQYAMIAALMTSDEYWTHSGGTNAGFINAAFTNLLNRSASSADISNWTTNTNLRSNLVQTLLHTPEFYQAQVSDLFLWYLRRYTNTPGDGTRLVPVGSTFGNPGFADALAAGTSPDTVRLQIITSAEYKYLIANNKATWAGTRWLDNPWLSNGV